MSATLWVRYPLRSSALLRGGDENGHMLSVLSLPLSLSLSSESDDGGNLDSALLRVIYAYVFFVECFISFISEDLCKKAKGEKKNNESRGRLKERQRDNFGFAALIMDSGSLSLCIFPIFHSCHNRVSP